MKPSHPLLARIMPYLMIAFAILVFVLVLFVFSYIFIAVLIIGLIVFVVGFIRTKFFGHKKHKNSNDAFRESFFVIQTNLSDNTHSSETKKPAENTGRIIEHDKE